MKDILVCEKCGSFDVQIKAWVNANDLKYMGCVSGDEEDCWCDICEEHNELIPQSDFIKIMDNWFDEIEYSTISQITGIAEPDYNDKNECESFDDKCIKIWNKMDYFDKRGWYNRFSEEDEDD